VAVIAGNLELAEIIENYKSEDIGKWWPTLKSFHHSPPEKQSTRTRNRTNFILIKTRIKNPIYTEYCDCN